MKTNIGTIYVELNNDERETLNKAEDIIRELIRTMDSHNCDTMEFFDGVHHDSEELEAIADYLEQLHVGGQDLLIF